MIFKQCEKSGITILAFSKGGILYKDEVEQEIVNKVLKMTEENPDVKAILLECSMMPPYSKAVYEATRLPVFDYISMIDFVHSAVVKRPYIGEM